MYVSLILQPGSFQEYHLLIHQPANGYYTSSPAPILVDSSSFPLSGSFIFTLLRSRGRRSKLPGDWLQALIRTKNLGGTSLGVSCKRWWAGATHINGGGSKEGGSWGRSVLWGHGHKGLPTPYCLGRGLVQLSWSGPLGNTA